MIYVICPFSKPEFRDLTYLNFVNQNHREKHLVIIENGKGNGSFEPCSNITVLKSEPHQSLAKNVGLSYLREIGAEYWASMDCDDYYGPEYLSEIEENKNRSAVVGKKCYYVRLDNGVVILCGKSLKRGMISSVWGATIGAWVQKSPDFPVISVGEEEAWSKNFNKFFGIYNTGPDNFMHLRWPQSVHTTSTTRHAWMRSPEAEVVGNGQFPKFLSFYLKNNEYHIETYDPRFSSPP